MIASCIDMREVRMQPGREGLEKVTYPPIRRLEAAIFEGRLAQGRQDPELAFSIRRLVLQSRPRVVLSFGKRSKNQLPVALEQRRKR